MAASTISTTAKAFLYLVQGWVIGPRGQVGFYQGWIDTDTHHGSLSWQSGWISWKAINPNSEVPTSTRVSSLEELLKNYTIEAEDGGVPIDLKENASFIVDIFNQANDQVNRKE